MTAQGLITFALKELGVENPKPSELEDGFTALNFELAKYNWDYDGDAGSAFQAASLAEDMDVLTKDMQDLFTLKVAARLSRQFGQSNLKKDLLAEAEIVDGRIRYRALNNVPLNIQANTMEIT